MIPRHRVGSVSCAIGRKAGFIRFDDKRDIAAVRMQPATLNAVLDPPLSFQTLLIVFVFRNGGAETLWF